MRRGLALGGFSGVGKSTVGALVAARVGTPFVDTDAILAARWGPIPAQIRADERAFRARESAVLAEVLAGPPCVIATGGGVWADAGNRARLRGAWRVVLLAPLEEIRTRVAADPTERPAWGPGVEERFASRIAAYEDADLLVDTSGRAPGELADLVARWWLARAAPHGYSGPSEGG